MLKRGRVHNENHSLLSSSITHLNFMSRNVIVLFCHFDFRQASGTVLAFVSTCKPLVNQELGISFQVPQLANIFSNIQLSFYHLSNYNVLFQLHFRQNNTKF